MKNNRIIILLSSIIISVILWNTYVFVQNFKIEERNKMEIWSLATLELIEVDGKISNLTLEVLKKNKTTPMIKIDNDGSVEINNIDNISPGDSLKISSLVKKFASVNEPIKIFLEGKQISTLYYGNSDLMNKLTFYPIALLLLAVIFGFVAFLFFKSSKIAEINMLWSGMAKETAHQIGTPLTSMMGWLELLKNKSKEKKYLSEIEKDLERLNIISDRFSKIGSKPKLSNKDICKEIDKTVDYLSIRLSKKTVIDFENSGEEIFANINSQLFAWCIENIIKNSVDSIKEEGKVSIKIEKLKSLLKIYIIDNGIGIKKSLHRKIFHPGFTTKDRGWGLGLSLAKRIIEEFHKGEIKVFESTVGQGTKILINLKVGKGV